MTPEAAVQDAMAVLFASLGDRSAHLQPGAMEPGQHQFFVCGGFFVTPDEKHQMLVGNTGFPPDQRRLLIPIDGGHPGRVIATGQPLLLDDTRKHASFQQYLRTARMGSAVYAPLIWEGRARGLVIMAAQAGGTMRQQDLDALIAVAPAVRDRWLATGGPEWLAAEYAKAVTGGG
jgi:signal transduction protein with GAF and PtsI domain